MARVLKILLPVLIALDVSWRLFLPEPSLARDFIFYNSLWLVSLAVLLSRDFANDIIATGALSLAIFLWGIGSLLTSIDQLILQSPRFTGLSQLLYLLFYPLLLIAIPRLSSTQSKLGSIEVLDALIFGLGFTSIITSLLLSTIFEGDSLAITENFYLLLYFVGDLALLLATSIALLTSGVNRGKIYFLLAISIFAATDFWYLFMAISHSYSFGAIADDGWIIAIALLAFSTHQKSSPTGKRSPIHPALVAISIFVSPILLAVSALKPNLLPTFILIPSVSNLLLAFIRISATLRETRSLTDERLLARTDELTGLANRRRLLSEIESFSHIEGALLLLDLNEFKPVNDQYGHAAGDAILKQVAVRFSRVLSGGSLLARLGGDEFGVLIKGGYQETLEVAYALHAALSYPFDIEGHTIKVGVSIGHIQNDGAGDLLRRADNAMYIAKQMGTGGVHSLSL